MKKGILVVLAAATSVLGLRAQERAGHGEHAHPRNEAGLSLGAAYGIEHKEWAPAIHAHYFRTLAPHSRWALGAGIEFIPGEERHWEIGAGARFQVLNDLQLSLMPGISIVDKAKFSLHTEAVYEAIHLGGFHFGPVVGYAWTRDHSHVSAGHTCRFCILNGKDHEQVWDHPAQHCHDSPGGNLYRGLVGCEPDRLVARNASTGAVVRTVPKREKTMNNFLKTECGK